MPERIRIANAKRSAVRSKVEHVFGDQKNRMGLFIRTIGIDRAKLKIGMVNIAYTCDGWYIRPKEYRDEASGI